MKRENNVKTTTTLHFLFGWYMHAGYLSWQGSFGSYFSLPFARLAVAGHRVDEGQGQRLCGHRHACDGGGAAAGPGCVTFMISLNHVEFSNY